MYGTVNEICEKLLYHFDSQEKFSVIVWTEGIVNDFIGERGISDEDVKDIVRQIADLDSLYEYGVCAETLHAMVDNLLEERAEKREISVQATMLNKAMALAQEFIRLTDIESGEGAAQRFWPEQVKALETLRNQVLE